MDELYPMARVHASYLSFIIRDLRHTGVIQTPAGWAARKCWAADGATQEDGG